MYKDKHLQKEANRRASQRRRDKKKGMTRVPEKGMTVSGCDGQGMTERDWASNPGDDSSTLSMTPLDVYSEHRWQFLKSKGYVWDVTRQRAFKPDGTRGVTVPGDPGYKGICQEVVAGICRSIANAVEVLDSDAKLDTSRV